MADAADECDDVLLEPLPGTTPVTQAAAGELALDVRREHGKARGQALHDHGQGPAVGFSGGQVAQHPVRLLGASRQFPL